MDILMDRNDFRQSRTYRFFIEQLCSQFELRNFRQVELNELEQSNEHRYLMRFVRDFHDIHGRRLQNEVKFAAIPMADRILVCHAKVKGRECTVRFKAECTEDPRKLEELRVRFVRNLVDRVDGMCGITLDDLPDEVQLYIIQNLDLFSLLNLAKSSHYWHTLIKENNWLWKIIYKRDFGQGQQGFPFDRKTVMNWKSAYESEMQKRRHLHSARSRWIHNALPPLPYFPALPFYENFPPNIPDEFGRFPPNLPDNFGRFPLYGPIELFWYDQL